MTGDTTMPVWSRLKRGIARAVGRSQQQRSNRRYARGDWSWLGDLGEMAHYSVLAGYAQFLRPGGSVLDVGCGEGLLRERLGPGTYSRYVGVDFDVAIRRATERAHDATSFVIGDMHTFVPDAPFDVIIFNESVYYFDDVVRGLRRYEAFLAPGGVILLSIFNTEKNARRWTGIRAAFDIKDEVTVRNADGRAWTCAALIPRGADSGSAE
jgi:SAM-dependent methyltransferase